MDQGTPPVKRANQAAPQPVTRPTLPDAASQVLRSEPGNLVAMPIYEFRCSECEVHFDERRSIAQLDSSPPPCPSGHSATRRVLSIFATATRGSDSCGPDASSAGGCGGGCACAAGL
ncbi:MAG: FmdB family zinc ribbon protein [Acidimicrobiales bacterium]